MSGDSELDYWSAGSSDSWDDGNDSDYQRRDFDGNADADDATSSSGDEEDTGLPADSEEDSGEDGEAPAASAASTPADGPRLRHFAEEFIPLSASFSPAPAAPGESPAVSRPKPGAAPLLGWSEAPWKTHEYAHQRAIA